MDGAGPDRTVQEGDDSPEDNDKVYGKKDLLEIALTIAVFVVLAGLPGLVDYVRPGFSDSFWRTNCSTRVCFSGLYALYFLLVVPVATLVILKLPAWIWTLLNAHVAPKEDAHL